MVRHFADPDVARFSESGTVGGGSRGGKAWRSRYYWGEGALSGWPSAHSSLRTRIISGLITNVYLRIRATRHP
jgi:hypothetical protein